MKFLLSSLVLAGGVLAATSTTSTCMKKKIIIDTDFWNLPDDVNALGIANAFQSWGEADIMGVISSIRSRYAPPAIDAVDTFYGHPDIEVAISKPLDPSTYDPDFPKYGGWVETLGTKFPEDIEDGYNTTDPVLLYRKLLSIAGDNTVTIVVIGFFDSLYQLINSPADEISSFTGWELIGKKVAELVVQADPQAPSAYNLAHHNGTFAADVLNEWPKKLTFVPGYVGRGVRMGAKLAVDLDPNTNPIAFVWNATIGTGNLDGSWDPAAMYYAVRGLDNVFHYNKTDPTGGVIVSSNGSTSWDDEAEPSGVQNWVDLSMDSDSFAEKLEDILLWEPGQDVPTKLKKCTAPTPVNTTSATSVPLGTPFDASSTASTVVGRGFFVGVAVLAVFLVI